MKKESEIIQELESKIVKLSEDLRLLKQVVDRMSLIMERSNSRIEYLENRVYNIDSLI